MSQRIWTQDATDTPVVSGSSATNAKTSLTLITPNGANRLRFQCSAAAVWGDNTTLDGGGDGKGFIPVAANTWACIPTLSMDSTTVKTATGSGNFRFYFFNSVTTSNDIG